MPPSSAIPGDDGGSAAPAIEELLRSLGKASRAYQLYLHNNPTYHRALDVLRRSFAPVWEQLPELVLTVAENELLWEQRPVYQELERTGDTIPWLLFKDGVRELRVQPGFEEAEVERFLEVLRLLGRSAASDDDAITLLWERDFAFLRHRFVEPAADDGAGEFRLSPQPGRLNDATPVAPPPAGVVSIEDFDSAPFFLAERELEYLRAALADEYRHDLFADAVAMVLDTFETQPSTRARDELCGALEMLLVKALTAGNYRAVAGLLRETAVTVGRAASTSPEHRARLDQLAARLSTPDGLAQLVEALEVTEALPADDELAALFAQLRPPALGPVLGWLGRVQAPRLRGALRAAADRIAVGNTAELGRLVGSEDPVVALEATRRAGALRLTSAVPPLGAVLRAEASELRLAAAQALAEIGSTGALQLLAGALDDPEREVRLVVLRAITAQSYRAALPRLDALIRERRLRERDLTEQMAAFEAFGSLCGDEQVGVLDQLLNGRSLIGRRQEPSLRACAAVALGRVKSERARAALARAADEKDVVVRTAVQRAVRGQP